MKKTQEEQWTRKLVAKGISVSLARSTVAVLRQHKSDLDDGGFGQWLDSVDLPAILKIVGEQTQQAGGTDSRQGA